MDDNTPVTDVTDADLEALRDEALILGEEDESMIAERLFRENLPRAVLSIIKLATSSQSERVRLNASQYIVERNLGRLQDMNPYSGGDALLELVEELSTATEGTEALS